MLGGTTAGMNNIGALGALGKPEPETERAVSSALVDDSDMTDPVQGCETGTQGLKAPA